MPHADLHQDILDHHDKVLIVDFGSQVTQLIARRVREAGVYCEIVPFQSAEAAFHAVRPKAVILSGGPASVLDPTSPRAPQAIFEAGIPVLGICYGQQTMLAEQLGGAIAWQPSTASSAAPACRRSPRIARCSEATSGRAAAIATQVWMSHGDARDGDCPPGFRAVATSRGTPRCRGDRRRSIAASTACSSILEVVHTPHGASAAVGTSPTTSRAAAGGWTMGGLPRRWRSPRIREQVGTRPRDLRPVGRRRFSSVAAVLIHEAIGDQLTCIFVDHGLLRAGEADEVVSTVPRTHYNIHARARATPRAICSLSALEGRHATPRTKRKIDRPAVRRDASRARRRSSSPTAAAAPTFLAQGTLYPDVIESVSVTGGPSVTIKSHHNVGGLPERMRMTLVEPLRELFKDEVRALGRELGLPEAIVGRHPFPGPGLAIRIPGAVDRERVEILQRADRIFLEEIRTAGLYDAIWQAFVVLLPVRTVGVMGDGRTYDHACALRAVTSTDGMTAEIFPFDMGFLTRVAGRIVNEVRGINRVTYDITSKPPGTIEWE